MRKITILCKTFSKMPKMEFLLFMELFAFDRWFRTPRSGSLEWTEPSPGPGFGPDADRTGPHFQQVYLHAPGPKISLLPLLIRVKTINHIFDTVTFGNGSFQKFSMNKVSTRVSMGLAQLGRKLHERNLAYLKISLGYGRRQYAANTIFQEQ